MQSNGFWLFHHLGVACKSVEQEAIVWEKVGYSRKGEAFVDPIQGVRGEFWVGPGPCLEFLENLDCRDVLNPWINKGIKIYHQAFIVNDIHEQIERVKFNGAVLVQEPTKSVAFHGKEIAFVFLKNMSMIEFIQR
ncbi:VOC family protein [Endozoicomonas sp. 8E]|uniref:VOC family protein n=1 Tax=Endozoicomonas sp. 8E TaxID=3035692 RepID=UPI0029390AEC|nr:VOC family protein [Endozoicomonas sp. 8E]WOG26341.1 VOC family protein [Endozoicomonas sp. 8E]